MKKEWKVECKKDFKKKRKREERRAAASFSSSATPSLTAIVPSNPTARSIKRVHPAITSPLNASQPGAPCNCVSHQPAITFKGAVLEASVIRNPGWPRPGLRHYSFYLASNYRSNKKEDTSVGYVHCDMKTQQHFSKPCTFSPFLVSAEHLHPCFFNKLTL